MLATFFDIDGCRRGFETQAGDDLRELALNGSLMGVGNLNPWKGPQMLRVLDPKVEKSHDVALADVPRLQRRRGSFLVLGDGSLELDPATATTSSAPTLPIRSASRGALSVTLPDGSTAPVASEVPHGVGDMFFLDEKGTKTALAKSAALVASKESFAAECMGSPTKGSSGSAFVSCHHFAGGGGHTISAWDATGRHLFDHEGTYVTFSPDGSRIHLLSYNTENEYLIDTSTGRDIIVRRREEFTATDDAAFDGSGDLLAWDAFGIVDSRTGHVVRKPARLHDAWIGGTDLLAVGREGGGLQIEDARTGKVMASLEDDVRIISQSDDGAVLLTQDNVDTYRARDAKTFAELGRIGRVEVAMVSADGKFLFAQGSDAIIAHRLADGAELYLAPLAKPGERSLVYTKSGLYDGGDAAIAMVRFRVGGVASGMLVPASEGPKEARRPHLAEDFFAGKAVE